MAPPKESIVSVSSAHSIINKETEENFVIRTLFAGMASMTAGFTLHPVDTCKIRMQKNPKEGPMHNPNYRTLLGTVRQITQAEGLRSLYKGLTASMMRESTYSTLRLGLYEPIKELLGEKSSTQTPFWKKFLSGGLSGSIGGAIANPADLLKVRLQAHEDGSKGLLAEIKSIWKSQGIKGFYAGTTPNIVRALVLNGTKLATYDHTKQTILAHKWMENGTPLFVFCSIVSGLCMTCTTAPWDTVKTRLMNQSVNAKVYNGMVDCFIKSIKNDGFFVLWRGFLPQFLRFVPFTIIQLTVWEFLRKLFGMKGI